MLAEGLKASFLQAPDIDVLGVAFTGAEAIDMFVKHRPDVVILDLRLPDTSGEVLAEKLRAIDAGCRIVVLTSHAQSFHIARMLTIGVNAYLLKSCQFNEILQAVEAVAAGNSFFCNEAMLVMNQSSEQRSTVTKRELEVLKLIVAGLTNHEIADKLFISPLTVDSHRKNLLLKFNVRNTAALVGAATVQGYIE